jgi:glycosyltransferase involved in cell wall biosynthesis
MRILWISIRIFDNYDEYETAVWLKALAIMLSKTSSLTLANISCKNGIKVLTRCDYGQIQQWAFPVFKINRHGYPSKKISKLYDKILKEFKPDIVQIWGSENFFKLLPFQKEFHGLKVLTMQGVLSSIEPNILRGLTLKEVFSTIGIREIATWRNLFTIKSSFKNDAILEQKMINRSDLIITQSEWTESQIKTINSNLTVFRTQRVLRNEFIECKKWTDFIHYTPILYSASVGYSIKGLPTLIKAMAIIKEEYPTVVLKLAGAIGRKDILGDGYLRFILRLIRKHNLEKNVIWLGPITAIEVVHNLQDASVFINPSLVESFSMVLAEAMSVGTPSVVAFSGGMPELADNNTEALFFSPLDYKYCAFQILKILRNPEMAKRISSQSVLKSNQRIAINDIVNNQLNLYEKILKFQKR